MTEAPSGPAIDGLVLIEHLGTGGYSDVYLYERRSPRMKVAVKVLKDVRLSHFELQQFAAEAETMAELADHPYIVQVFSTDTTGDGRPYLVMKYYPPPNLFTRSARERFAVPDVLRTGIQISSAVETAHRAGILHRDIKPANILVSQYGEPGLTDFGIAGRAAETDQTDDLGVSIPWSPPEVLSGASNGSVQSDVYSLAATTWHLLVGRSPFEIAGGDNAPRALMARVLRTPPPATGRADVPVTLERLLHQAMSKVPSMRPKSALEFARALQVIEQEQRFVRTEVVVDGLRAATAPTDERRAIGGDQTRLRSPVRVAAQLPSAPPRLPPPPATPPARSGAQSAPSTFGPPAVAVASNSSSTQLGNSPRTRVAIADLAPASTVRRPASPAGADSGDDVLASPRRGLKRTHVGVIAATAVLAAVVLGIVLTSGGSKRDPGRKDQPTVLATDQTQPFDARLAPVVSAKYDPARHVIHFSWTAQAAQPGDIYIWVLSGQNGKQTRTRLTHVDVKSPKPADTCIQVRVLPAKGGQSDLSEPPTCGG